MEALGWALIALVSIAWLALSRAVGETVETDRFPPPDSSDASSPRARRLWLDHKPPFA